MKIYRDEDRQEHEELWSKYKLSMLQSWLWTNVKAKSSKFIRTRLVSYPVTIHKKNSPVRGLEIRLYTAWRASSLVEVEATQQLRQSVVRIALQYLQSSQKHATISAKHS